MWGKLDDPDQSGGSRGVCRIPLPHREDDLPADGDQTDLHSLVPRSPRARPRAPWTIYDCHWLLPRPRTAARPAQHASPDPAVNGNRGALTRPGPLRNRHCCRSAG